MECGGAATPLCGGAGGRGGACARTRIGLRRWHAPDPTAALRAFPKRDRRATALHSTAGESPSFKFPPPATDMNRRTLHTLAGCGIALAAGALAGSLRESSIANRQLPIPEAAPPRSYDDIFSKPSAMARARNAGWRCFPRRSRRRSRTCRGSSASRAKRSRWCGCSRRAGPRSIRATC